MEFLPSATSLLLFLFDNILCIYLKKKKKKKKCIRNIFIAILYTSLMPVHFVHE